MQPLECKRKGEAGLFGQVLNDHGSRQDSRLVQEWRRRDCGRWKTMFNSRA